MTATGKTSHRFRTTLILFVLPSALCGQAYFIPGDPKAGMQLFFNKGCVRCHAILGEGGRSAPDVARTPAGYLSAAELVAAMWNHAPAMWQKMRLERMAPPKFSVPEMTNLFAFLYSVRSLDEPGNAERGRKLLAEKKCLDCHSVAGQGANRGPDLHLWASYRNPVSWIQAMWNHGLSMQVMMEQRGLSWPHFQDSDMADLIACIRALAANSKSRAQLQLASPERGRAVFRNKRCDVCHAIGGAGARRGPDLGSRALPRTLGQFAGLMWNHAPAMWTSMRAQGVARPQFSNQEMADLISYLFTERYFEATGHAERGQRIFEDKGCSSCHGGGPAPDLSRWRGSASAIHVATALWNHGPLMLASMQQRQLAWPRFRSGEVLDLMEFLNRGTVVLGARR